MPFPSQIVAVAALIVASTATVTELPITRTSVAMYFPDFSAGNRRQSPLRKVRSHGTSLRAPRGIPLENGPNIFWDRLRSDTSSQVKIHENDDDDDDDDPLEWYWSMYTTPLRIGNPALHMDAIVDTSCSVLFVPSVNCTYNAHEIPHCAIHPLYNSSYSKTYHANSTPTSIYYRGPAGILTWGRLSQDSLHIGNIEIIDQIFEEAIGFHADFTTYDELFDTVLGLSLFPTIDPSPASNFTTESPFHNMIEQNLLDENLFTLKYPRTDSERGTISFGGLPPGLQRRDMIEVPLNSDKIKSSSTWHYYTMSGWQLSLESMSMAFNGHGNSTTVLDTPQIAVISSSFPFIALPNEVLAKIHKAIGIKQEFDWLDCDHRIDLPDWTIRFGSDPIMELTLTPWDYLIEMYDPYDGQLKCVSVFFSMDDWGDRGFVIFGAPFLNGLYAVFDADRRSISFKNRPL